MRRVQRSRKKLPLESLDLIMVLDSLNIDYREHGKNVALGWVGVNCPFCGDNNFHLGINLRHKSISCWKCGTTGNIIKFLSEVLGSFNKALDVLSESIPKELIRFETRVGEKSAVSVVHLPKNAKQGLSPYHKAYLKKRKFNPDLLEEKYNLYHVGPVGEFKNRIIIPIMHRFKLITFTSVDISNNSKVRYLHCPDELSIVPIKNWLCGIENTNSNSIILVEGLFDWWRFGDGACPTWGVKMTQAQIKLASKFPFIKVVGDGDKAGHLFNERVGNSLASFSRVKYFTLDEGIDPDDLTEEEIKFIKDSR